MAKTPVPPPSKTPAQLPDRHYSFGGLNMVFAWGSLALLAVSLWMVFDDYAKPWKRMQAQFRDLERQTLAGEAEAERQQLDANALAQLRSDVDSQETALREHRDEIARLEGEAVQLGQAVYAADAAARGTKSLLDTARYGYERALAGGEAEQVAEAQAEVDRLSERLRTERRALEELSGQRDAAQARLAELRSGATAAEERLAALQEGVSGLEQRGANLAKSVDYFLLNAPLLDFVSPPLKVEQVILPGLFQDINFTRVDRVDRCMTCHAAVGRAGFDGEEWQEPFRSHPRLELFVGASSPHPYNRFGCTVCHGGLDRATDFARAGHSPASEEERAAWVDKWGWEKQPYLDTPILPAALSEAGCVTCHAADVWTPQSNLQDVGRELMSRMGCYGCHAIDYPAFQALPKAGPDLRRIAAKTRPEWAYRWIEAPRDFHPTTFMPHFFFQENIEGELNEARQRAEIAAVVAFLWDRSEQQSYSPAPAGEAARGQQLFETVGCQGCHILDADATRDQFFPQINRLHGPNLVRTGSKVSSGWLYAWLKNPKGYSPNTRMPSLRLTDQEAADLTAYLVASRDPAYDGLRLPTVDGQVRDELVRTYLQATRTLEASEAELTAMSAAERDVFLGQMTIQKYGCYGCHEIAGFEEAKPIGVELTAEGSKPLHQFDFANVHDVAHTRQDWIHTKLLQPRIWDHGKELVKNYDELLKMPNFGMTEREATAVLSNVMGFTEEGVVASRRAGQDARAAALAAGRQMITAYNCRGCHLIEGQGHAIRSAIEDVGKLPPNLAAEGARVQAEWLFGYLHDPSQATPRPWLGARMPTFGFDDGEVNTVVSYFAAREERRPFLSPPTRPDERELGVGAVVFNMLQCARCHPAGEAAAAALGVATGELAPSLELARARLRHDWVPHWIKDPQSWIRGTNMPSNFPKAPDGHYDSPLVQAIDAPMFAQQKQAMLRYFGSDGELKEYLGDVDRVTGALRDHIWWSIAP